MQFIEKMDIDKLRLWEKNPRFNDEAAERLAKVLKKHGFIDPVIIDENNIVRAGNTRVKAAKLAGIKSVPVLIVNFKNEQAAEAYSIADNKANEWAKWDYLGLKEIIDSIGDYNYEDIGFTKEEYDAIFNYEDFNPDEYFGEKLEKKRIQKKKKKNKKSFALIADMSFILRNRNENLFS